MIWHPVRQLIGAGIREIMIVTSTHHMGSIVNSLGSGLRFGCDFTYRVQEEAKGIAHALALARGFAAGASIVVMLGDNVFEHSIVNFVNEFRQQGRGARVMLKEVGDPERYGVAAMDEKLIVEIEEKPSAPKSHHAVVGCYAYDERVFEVIDGIAPSARGEFEITAVNNRYIESGELQYSFVRGAWTDAGTFESLQEANALLLSISNTIKP
jgi:glucose-1-phosphate thymidylyltransferase